MTPAGAAPSGAVARVAKWFHDRTCMSWDDVETDGKWSRSRCARPSHIAMFKPKAKQAVAATSIQELAALIHWQTCAADAERAHGEYFEARSDRWCGVNGEHHIAQIAQSVPVVTLWEEMSQ